MKNIGIPNWIEETKEDIEELGIEEQDLRNETAKLKLLLTKDTKFKEEKMASPESVQ